MGTGDWNDGMNRVGSEGRGESVWLAEFQVAALDAFAEAADRLGRHDDAQELRGRAEPIRQAVNRDGWDGHWFRRAYFDDGTPLGSATQRRMPDRLDRPDLGRPVRDRVPGSRQ